MNDKQQAQFNQMLATLKMIASGYESLHYMRKNCEKNLGLDYEEALEMAYENIKQDAKIASSGVRPIKQAKAQ